MSTQSLYVQLKSNYKISYTRKIVSSFFFFFFKSLEWCSSAALHGEIPDCSNPRLARQKDSEGKKQLDSYKENHSRAEKTDRAAAATSQKSEICSFKQRRKKKILHFKLLWLNL